MSLERIDFYTPTYVFKLSNFINIGYLRVNSTKDVLYIVNVPKRIVNNDLSPVSYNSETYNIIEAFRDIVSSISNKSSTLYVDEDNNELYINVSSDAYKRSIINYHRKIIEEYKAKSDYIEIPYAPLILTLMMQDTEFMNGKEDFPVSVDYNSFIDSDMPYSNLYGDLKYAMGYFRDGLKKLYELKEAEEKLKEKDNDKKIYGKIMSIIIENIKNGNDEVDFDKSDPLHSYEEAINDILKAIKIFNYLSGKDISYEFSPKDNAYPSSFKELRDYIPFNKEFSYNIKLHITLNELIDLFGYSSSRGKSRYVKLGYVALLYIIFFANILKINIDNNIADSYIYETNAEGRGKKGYSLISLFKGNIYEIVGYAYRDFEGELYNAYDAYEKLYTKISSEYCSNKELAKKYINDVAISILSKVRELVNDNSELKKNLEYLKERGSSFNYIDFVKEDLKKLISSKGKSKKLSCFLLTIIGINSGLIDSNIDSCMDTIKIVCEGMNDPKIKEIYSKHNKDVTEILENYCKVCQLTAEDIAMNEYSKIIKKVNEKIEKLKNKKDTSDELDIDDFINDIL